MDKPYVCSRVAILVTSVSFSVAKPASRYLHIASQLRSVDPPRIGGDHAVVYFRHRTTCVGVERVRLVEWQQDKLLDLGQAGILYFLAHEGNYFT